MSHSTDFTPRPANIRLRPLQHKDTKTTPLNIGPLPSIHRNATIVTPSPPSERSPGLNVTT
jgi:hypothetical protein